MALTDAQKNKLVKLGGLSKFKELYDRKLDALQAPYTENGRLIFPATSTARTENGRLILVK